MHPEKATVSSVFICQRTHLLGWCLQAAVWDLYLQHSHLVRTVPAEMAGRGISVSQSFRISSGQVSAADFSESVPSFTRQKKSCSGPVKVQRSLSLPAAPDFPSLVSVRAAVSAHVFLQVRCSPAHQPLAPAAASIAYTEALGRSVLRFGSDIVIPLKRMF